MIPEPKDTIRGSRPARPREPFKLLSAAVLIAYLTALPGGFVWLDHAEIVGGGYLVQNIDDFRQIWTLSLDQYLDRHSAINTRPGGYWRPLAALSMSIDAGLWGEHPPLFHAVNILIHLVIVIGLYHLGRVLFSRIPQGEEAAFWGSMLFAVHPLGVHSVTWISGRKDLLCAAGCIAALLAYQQAITPLRRSGDAPLPPGIRFRYFAWLLAAGLAALAALLSKEAALMIVPLAILVTYAQRSRKDDAPSLAKGRVLFGLGLFTLLSVTYVGWRIFTLGAFSLGSERLPGTALQQVITQVDLLGHYIGLVLLPRHPLIADTWSAPITIFPREAIHLILPCSGILFLFLLRKRLPMPWLGGMWFLLWLMPVMGWVPLNHLRAERYLYPASWGLLVMLAYLLIRLLGTPFVTKLFFSVNARHVLGILTLLLALFTAWSNRIWRSDDTLFIDAVNRTPGYVEGHTALGTLSLNKGEYNLALRQFNTAQHYAEDSGQVSYYSAFVLHTNRGLALYHLKRYHEALRAFLLAYELRRNHPVARYHLGLVLTALDAPELAATILERSMKDGDDSFLTVSNLAYTKLRSGDTTTCIKLLTPLINAYPEDRQNRMNLAAAHLIEKDFGAARPHLNHLVEADPQDVAAVAKLGWAEWSLGNTTAAHRRLAEAHGLDPTHISVRHLQQLIFPRQAPDPPDPLRKSPPPPEN